MVTPETPSKTRAATDVITYVCILIVAALQFIVGYYGTENPNLWTRLLFLALVEAALAVLFFMHLWMESRRLLIAVFLVMIFVLISMQWSWPDSFRIRHGTPWTTT
jgi:cytochrome c oxidase subunit IV